MTIGSAPGVRAQIGVTNEAQDKPHNREASMIEKFTKAWFANLPAMRERFTAKHPDDYLEVVTAVIGMLSEADDSGKGPDPERIHEINDGDYQGTLLYVIGAKGYQPSTYWAVKVDYGSCSGCDTLQGIRGYRGGKPDDDAQVSEYMTLALHVIQGLREIGGGDEEVEL
jgi:hypothetical protein